MTYTVYILKTSGNTLYTGQTNNLERRLKQHASHKSASAKYLLRFTSFTLVYQEGCTTRKDALAREAAIKRMTKKKKESLIAAKKESK